MINIDLSRLNPLEQEIYRKIQAYALEHADLKITQAAEMNNCSISKVSKFVKKLGFKNYKQYMDFLYGREMPSKKTSNELDRIQHFIADFDQSLVDEFMSLLNSHEKIILFGYGPSFIVATYFEYKLRIFTNKFVIAVPDELSIRTMVDDKTLVVIFTATGSFRSFESVYQSTKAKGSDVLVIAEEYNTSLMSTCDRLFWLSKFPQSPDLKPHEKSRTVFFLFIEEVIQRLIEEAKALETIQGSDI